MEIQSNSGFIESLLAQKLLATPKSRQQNLDSAQDNSRNRSNPRDVIALSNPSDNSQGQLIREVEEPIENGIRLIQDFVTQDGRNFTRIQEFTQTDRGFQRDVVQQNASGTTSRFQEVLDRQDNGLFRRTLRFDDGIGAPQARIENNFVSRSPFVVSNGQNIGGQNQVYGTNPFDPTRGIRLDVSA